MWKKVTKRVLKILLWVVVGLIAIDLLIATLIIIPPIQQFVVLKASKILSDITGGEVTADKIYLSPTLTLTAKNFAIKDHHLENMIFASTLKGKINFRQTEKGKVCLSFAELDDGEVVLRTYAGEDSVNIAIWAKGFKNEEKEKNGFKLLFENIQLNDVRFVVINDDKRLHKDDNTIDYAFFELQHIHLNVENFLVAGPDISCKINSLTLCQHTGFEITDFTSNFRIYRQGLLLDSLHFTTPNSLFNGDFAFRYNDFKDYSDFVNLINFDTKINSASVSMKDVIYFAPALQGMDNHYIISGYVGGIVNHLQTKDIYLKFKQQTYFAGDFSLANVLDFKKSSFDVVFRDANINFTELEQFKLPKGKTIKLPDAIDQIEHSRITGSYRGSFTKFNANVVAETNLGTLEVEMNSVPKNGVLSLSGNIACNNLALGKIAHQPSYFNKVNLYTSIEGNAAQYENLKALVSSISLQLHGKITNMDICGYPLKDADFRGGYKQQNINLALNLADSLATFAIKGSANFANKAPAIDAVLTHANIKLYDLFSHFQYPLDATAKGFEKFILKMQQIPNLAFSMDSLQINMSGNNFNNFNGFVGVNYAKLTNGAQTSRIDWLRLNAINQAGLPHQYIVHSNAVNATFKTNYDYTDCMAALLNAAEYYIPENFGYESTTLQNVTASESEQFIDFDIQFYYTQNLFNLLLPSLNIARNTSASIHLGRTRDEDYLDLLFPQVRYAGLGKVDNLILQGKMNSEQQMELQLQCDSVSMYRKGNGALTFSNINATTRSNKKGIHFDTSWRNPKGISINERNNFSGILFSNDSLKPSLKVTDSKLFLRESAWQFIGDNNTITYSDKNFIFDNCMLTSDVGTISVNGELSKQMDKSCNILLENFDISLINNFTEKMRMTFAGNMALMGIINGKGTHYNIEGKSFVKDFVFNEEPLGDLLLDAVVLENGDPHFIGGIFSREKLGKVDISKFSYSDYLALPNRNIALSGKWDLKSKDLRVHADIDTLQLGFLSPFLASFSNIVTGDASGHLDFVMTGKDSLYFDGVVKVKKAQLGIAPLNTIYHITNQEILFDVEGLTFNNILLEDNFNNNATLSGYVHHSKFKDFKIDLNIATDRITALNTQKKTDASFFGNGFVSGNISIQGDTKQLNFTSQDIKTLPGSAITFPVSSVSSVSSSKGIYFISANTKNEIVIEKGKSSSTILNFDFVFDITRDADVKIELDPIDGILKCKTTGKLHLLYDTHSDNLNLDGTLAIASGRFHMSLKNFIPRDFTIVEGGTISFAGPLTSAQLNVSALYQKIASLRPLNPELGRTEVSALLGLTGNLMNPNPTFHFDFPRLSEEERNNVFLALDTVNQQQGIRQFFSFVFLNTFMNSGSNMSSGSNLNEDRPIGTGIDLVTGILNSFLSGEKNNVNIGVNYNNQDREYSVDAQVNLYNDKLLLKTNLGMGYDKYVESNSFIGEASLSVPINDNWDFEAFYFYDPTNAIDVLKTPQGGGISFKYRQDFNNGKDFAESWKVKNKDKKTKKVDVSNQNNNE